VSDDRKKPAFSLLRTFVLADLITLGNASCGMGSVLSSMSYVADGDRSAMMLALVLLPVALVFDVLDGYVARHRHQSSPLGADLDSLADVVSFGVAPAVIGFALGLRGLVDAFVLVYFVGCGIGRLARFNATAAELAGPSGKVAYYEGTPIPTSLLLVAMFGWFFAQGSFDSALPFGRIALGDWTFHPVALAYVVSGSLMASAIRIPKP